MKKRRERGERERESTYREHTERREGEREKMKITMSDLRNKNINGVTTEQKQLERRKAWFDEMLRKREALERQGIPTNVLGSDFRSDKWENGRPD